MFSTFIKIRNVLLVAFIFTLVLAELGLTAEAKIYTKTSKGRQQHSQPQHPPPHTGVDTKIKAKAKTLKAHTGAGKHGRFDPSLSASSMEMIETVAESSDSTDTISDSADRLGSDVNVVPLSMLLSSRYITNATNYLGIICDDLEVETIAVGYTFGIFGYAVPIAQKSVNLNDFGVQSKSNVRKSSSKQSNSANKKGSVKYASPSSKNPLGGSLRSAAIDENLVGDTYSSSSSSSNYSPISEFNAYSGFMASPGEVLATVTGDDQGYASNGIAITAEDYNLYNPHEVNGVDELNWTTIYATIMVVLRTKEIPQSIRISDGLVSVLTSLIAPNNQSIMNSATAFAVPDEDSGPIYDPQLNQDDDDGSLYLSIDKEWYAGMISAKKRAGRLAKFKAGNARTAEVTVMPAASSEQDLSIDDNTGDIFAISINIVIPNSAHAPRSVVDTAEIQPLDVHTCGEVLVWSSESRVFISNCVSTYDLFNDTEFTRDDDRTAWYILACISCVILIIGGCGTTAAANNGMGKPYAVEENNAIRFSPESYQPLGYNPNGSGWPYQPYYVPPQQQLTPLQSSQFPPNKLEPYPEIASPIIPPPPPYLDLYGTDTKIGGFEVKETPKSSKDQQSLLPSKKNPNPKQKQSKAF